MKEECVCVCVCVCVENHRGLVPKIELNDPDSTLQAQRNFSIKGIVPRLWSHHIWSTPKMPHHTTSLPTNRQLTLSTPIYRGNLTRLTLRFSVTAVARIPSAVLDNIPNTPAAGFVTIPVTPLAMPFPNPFHPSSFTALMGSATVDVCMRE